MTRGRTANHGRQYILDAAALDDNGVYECKAVNLVGSTTARTTVQMSCAFAHRSSHVSGSPRLTSYTTPLHVALHANISLRCPIDARPRASIEWYKNARSLSPLLLSVEQLKRFELTDDGHV